MHARPDASPPAPFRPHLPTPPPATLRYGAALLAVLAAGLIRLASIPLIGAEALPFAFFFPAIAWAAWYGRIGPAVAATVFGAVLGRAFLVGGGDGLLPQDARGWLVPLSFVTAAAGVAVVIELLHRVNDRARIELERRIQVDHASRESEQRFRTMADGLPLVVWVHDAEGRQQFVNRTFGEFFGVNGEQLSGTRWRELLHPEDADGYAREFMAALKQRRPFSAEVRVRRRDGEWRWIESWGRPRWSADGEFCGFVGASADITERKRSEAALRESQERLQLALASADMGAWSWDMELDRLEWSPEVYRIFGVETFGGTAAAFESFVHADDRSEMWRIAKEAVEQHRPYRHEYRIIRGDGKSRWIGIRARADYHPDGRPRRMLGVVTDVTDRKRVEEELAAARDQALAASRAKDRFLAMLSHELRTPLTPALMISAEFEQSPLVPAALHDELATVRASIELEARLIDDLLDIARVNRGKLHLQFGDCEAHAVLRLAVETVHPEFVGKHIALEWELDPAPAPLHGDSVRLQQVFWNVLRNAVKFTPPEGSVRLRSRVADAMWRLEITDSGVGIAAADLPRIFESFFQTSEGAEPRLGGLGLGLAISATIVQEHRGRIWAESDGPGCGSTFVIELPLHAAPAQSAPVDGSTEMRPFRQLRMLVVEDHEPTRSAFASLLRRRGHLVTAADGVDAAQREAAAQCFDLVISDLGLPDGDGLELMRHLRRRYGLCGIALSGHGMDSDIQNTRDAGFAVHLTKPVTLRKLDEALAQVMETLPVA